MTGSIRIEDEKGITITSHKYHSISECQKLMTRYTETFKIALEEERLFIVVVQDIKE